jgi:hypothetical protein
MRKLVTGRRVHELKKPHTWKFESKCPAKWVHVDCESGYIYVSKPKGGWRHPTLVQIEAAIKALNKARQLEKEQ